MPCNGRTFPQRRQCNHVKQHQAKAEMRSTRLVHVAGSSDSERAQAGFPKYRNAISACEVSKYSRLSCDLHLISAPGGRTITSILRAILRTFRRKTFSPGGIDETLR